MREILTISMSMYCKLLTVNCKLNIGGLAQLA